MVVVAVASLIYCGTGGASLLSQHIYIYFKRIWRVKTLKAGFLCATGTGTFGINLRAFAGEAVS